MSSDVSSDTRSKLMLRKLVERLVSPTLSLEKTV